MIARARDWQDGHPARLWLYNLHYFDDLNAPPEPARDELQRAFIRQWIIENPPVAGVG